MGVVDAERTIEVFFVVETVNGDVAVGVAIEIKTLDGAFRKHRHVFADGQQTVNVDGGGKHAKAVVCKNPAQVEAFGFGVPCDVKVMDAGGQVGDAGVG